MTTLAITTTVDRIRTMYAENPRSRKMHALVVGEKGCGKTTLGRTCPKPVLIHSFDPGGTEVLEDLVESGDILVDNRFETDDLANPTAYANWEREYRQLATSGFFDSIGTYVIDSTTTLCSAMINQIMKKEGRLPSGMMAKTLEGQGMRIQDWGTLLRNFNNIARSLASLPCHTLILGHIGRDKDEATGRIINVLLLPGKNSDQFPINLSEFYVLMATEKSGKVKRELLTQYDGSYRATTRMGGGGKLDKFEKPDISAILKKAGYPFEDQPKL